MTQPRDHDPRSDGRPGPTRADPGAPPPDGGPRVVIIGGGLAGLAAAATLAGSGLAVTLVEARRRVGGRAASFEDGSGSLVDACQHVAMGCCTNFLDLLRQAGLADAVRCDRTLWFIGPGGDRSACTPSRWLPAPLHLAPLLVSMRHFTWRQRAALASGMLRLARLRDAAGTATTALEWLRAAGQPDAVIRLFWQPVIESALGESIDLVAVTAARKVVVDGFLAHRRSADLWVPTVPLGELLGVRLAAWLAGRGVDVRTGWAATALERDASGRVIAVVGDAGRLPCDAAIIAVPWRRAGRLVPDLVPDVDDRFGGSPITAVHLWFERQVIDLPHAVLVGRTSQWVFRSDSAGTGHCQVVISASRGLLGDRQQLLDTVVAELRAVFPAAAAARLLDAKVVTDPTAVLSVRPGVDAVRPPAATATDTIALAGDWTATGWPSTMEGAVRSGRRAAAVVAARLGRPAPPPCPDLPRAVLVRLLVGASGA
jgi:squalene-associated FAD-dependent desaturase